MSQYILTSGILSVSIILFIVSATLKYRTGTSNSLIALIEVTISLMIWSIISAIQFRTLIGTGDYLWSVIGQALKFGIISAAIPILVWDTGHGVMKYRKTKKKEN